MSIATGREHEPAEASDCPLWTVCHRPCRRTPTVSRTIHRPETDLKVMATALGASILLEATIDCALFVSALMALLGRWNWWLPTPAARLPEYHHLTRQRAISPTESRTVDPTPRHPHSWSTAEVRGMSWAALA